MYLLHFSISVTSMAGAWAGQSFAWAAVLGSVGHQWFLTTSQGWRQKEQAAPFTRHGLLVPGSETHQADGKTEVLSMSFNVLSPEKGSCGVWARVYLNRNTKQPPTGSCLIWSKCRLFWLPTFFFSWNPLVTSVCAAEGDTHDTSFLTVLVADSRTCEEWHQVTFLKVISCPWSLQRSHSLKMRGGRKQTLFCQRRNVWGSCNRRTRVLCVCRHPLWHALPVNTHCTLG